MTSRPTQAAYSILKTGLAGPLRRWGAIAMAAALCCGSVRGAEHSATSPLYTSKARFRIPFQFDAAEMQRLGASAIELYVSTDEGQSWTDEQSVPPSNGKFSFEAPQDGEYWFAVRTIDRNQNRYPEGDLQSGLRVVVDTVSPSLEIHVSPLGADRVSLSWDADDDNLDLNTLHIEFRDESTRDWQPVSMLAAPSGLTSWATRGQVEIRATVSDLAGNTAEASDDTSSSDAGFGTPPNPPATDRSQRSEQPDFSKPVAENLDRPALPQFPELRSDEAPATAALPQVRGLDSTTYVRRRPTTAMLANSDLDSRPAVTQPRWDDPATDSGTESASETAPPADAGVRRSVRGRAFKIDYQLDDVGPSGVATVDLYITENGGRKWYHYGQDADRRSPFDVVVPRDGEYGFAIRVQSGVGVAADPPQPGDLPEISIVVDHSPPVAQLMPLRQGLGAEHNRILIEWTLVDDRLADLPVALSYSEGPTGPWKPITDWIDNRGRYVWTITEPVRRSLYVRLEARDAAGNMTEARSTQPVMVDLSKPTARIVNIEAETRATPK